MAKVKKIDGSVEVAKFSRKKGRIESGKMRHAKLKKKDNKK